MRHLVYISVLTNAVNDDNGSVGETVYVGLYKGSGGIIANTLSIPHLCQFVISLHLCGVE